MAVTDYKLKFLIEADAKSAKNELSSINAEINGLGGISKAFSSAIPVAGALAAGIGTVATGLYGLARSASEFGSEIYDASQKTGLSATALSAMKAAAETSGASLETVTKGIARFAKQYKGDSGDLQAELGKVFKQIADAKPGFEQLTLAQKNFGKSGADLIPFIRSFDGDVEKLIQTMSDLGITIDDKAAAAADQFGDQMDILEKQIAAVGVTIGNELLPAFITMSKTVSEWLANNKDDIREWGTATGNVILGVIGYWRDLKKELSTWRAFDMNALPGTKGFSAIDLFQSTNPLSIILGALNRRGAAEPQQYGPYAWEMSPGRPGGVGDPDKDGGGGGKKIRPPKESDGEFRRFFTDLGFSVVRTYGKAINAGSPHTYGGAADLSIRGKSASEIFMLMVKALEKGYRVFDERKPAPGVKQTGPHVHVENAKTSLEKASRFLDIGFSPEQMAYLRDLDKKRLGKATGMGGFEAFLEANKKELAREGGLDAGGGFLAGAKKVMAAWVAEQKKAADEAGEIRRAEAEQALVILKSRLDAGLITEAEYAETVGQLNIDMLQAERDELAKQFETRDNIHKIKILDLKIDTAQLEKENAIADANERQLAAIRAQGSKSAQGALAGLGGDLESTTSMFDGLDAATGKIRSFEDIMQGLGQTASDVFMQMGQGLGAMLQSWVLMGDQADVSMSKMVASVLAGVAAQAATLSIFHLAMGLVALTPWGAAMYGPATNHFIASAIWGGIAAGAAIGGRAIAGNSFKSGSGKGSSAGASGSSNLSPERDLTPYTRASATAYMSGGRYDEMRSLRQTLDRLDTQITKFNEKVDSAKPGDVFIRGMKANRGAVGEQVAADIRSNSATGTKIGRAIGIR